MKILTITTIGLILAFSANATEAEKKSTMPIMQDCPMWKNRQQDLNDMQRLLDSLHEDCAQRKELCTNEAQIKELQRIHAEIKAAHDMRGNMNK